MAAVVSAQQVWRIFQQGDRRHEVLRGVDLQIARGETAALLGRSGSGKSTLLHLLGGIDRPDRGRILWDGRSLSGVAEPELTRLRRRHVGFVYQFFHLIPTLSVAENVALPLELLGTTPAQMAARVGELLELTGMARRADSFPDQLSGGEQQRVAVARALVHRPALLLADEPTGNLDATTGQLVLDLLLQLCTDHETSLVIVTHSLAVAQQAGRVLTLQDGLLTADTGGFAW